MSVDPAIRDHQAWLGYLQPDGLVVSPAALVDSQVMLPQDTLQLQQRFVAFVGETPADAKGDTVATIADFPAFACEFLEWPDDCLIGKAERPIPDALNVALPELGDTLSPTFAFRDVKPKDPANPWLFLGQVLEVETDMDAVQTVNAAGWSASPGRRFERLLRESRVPIGILTNGTHIRLMYAPRGENAGSLTFPVAAMMEVAGRPILAAFDLLLNRYRLLAAPSEARLPALLAKSREYQSRVSAALAQQVLDALYELLRGFQAANDGMKGELLREVLAKDPDSVYAALVNVLLRLVFLLYAEDRGLMPGSSLYVGNYAVHGLFERLREDAERYPDTMDHRFGAWAQLLAVFRVVYDGCRHPQLAVPARKGYLFDPQRFPFLEGTNEGKDLPLVADGVIYRVLRKLLILDGERLSYRTLDVEEIGSVYQTIMGFGVEIAGGISIALKGKRKHGGVPAAPVIDLEILLAATPSERIKWLRERADTDVTGEAEKRLKSARSMDDLLAALDKRIDRGATPAPVSKGGLVLQPTDERRRTGSHYTPRSFTEPIVRKTLEPILNRLGRHPKPEEILALKVCDIAVGSGAFLVETCRQLADELISSWHYHHQVPVIPPDEDEILFARRLVAQRCLYGVDRNAMAVDLAKLSLWLATLAKDHPFTFIDHAIRCGDSLVGLTRRQIETFTWKTEFTTGQLWEQEVRKCTAAALRERQNLLGLGDDYGTPQLKREKLEKADELLDLVRFIGDAAVAAFFVGDRDKAREAKRAELAARISDYLSKGDLKQRPTDEVKALHGGQFSVRPFHWEIEFSEAFVSENPGFDAIVGNPPYVAGRNISGGMGDSYLDWLTSRSKVSPGQSDLAAHFVLRAFLLCNSSGNFGLITTNTISQGDSAQVGLGYAVDTGATIYFAVTMTEWPGAAAVHISEFCVSKGIYAGPVVLDGVPVKKITAVLKPDDFSRDKHELEINRGRASKGYDLGGDGFVLTESEYHHFISEHPGEIDVIRPHINGKELYDRPDLAANRYVINFLDWSLERAAEFPSAFARVRSLVKPYRETVKRKSTRERWWIFNEDRPGMRLATQELTRVLVKVLTSNTWAFVFLPNHYSFDQALIVFAMERFSEFVLLQSRVHEAWAKWNPSTMKSDARYTIGACFTSFPFPAGFETNAALEVAGREYYEFRAALMQDLWLGLTEIYNLFHSPDDETLARLEALYRKRAANRDWRTTEGVPADRSPLQAYATPAAALAGVQRLRELHAAMDAAVLTAYGWTDLLRKCACEFLLDYEEDESGAEESTGRRKKKPWRYRWTDEVRDEVLARLLKLNAERAEEERLGGVAAAATELPKKRGRRKSDAATVGDLFDL